VFAYNLQMHGLSLLLIVSVDVESCFFRSPRALVLTLPGTSQHYHASLKHTVLTNKVLTHLLANVSLHA
jgi:hypothetical protein